ncbi:MAG: winged helix DNA-binding domain-containing protein [bacterium]|nr:winged helix DNA-binding domain-containing protein [bacterium]
MDVFTRNQGLAYRLRVNHLAGKRLPAGSLVAAAHSGLQDGSPRSALLSLAARVDGVGPDDWRAEGLAQVFGPRRAIYVVPEADVGVFTRGLLPRDPDRLAKLERDAHSVHEVLDGSPVRQSDVVAALPELGDARQLRRAATLGTLAPAWDTVDTIVHPVAPPSIDPEAARLELARRFFHFYGPATVKDLKWWLDGLLRDAAATAAALGDELAPVNVDGEECLATTATLPYLMSTLDPDEVLLLPPDDIYVNRLAARLLTPDPVRRKLLWPQAPPPGALIVGGEACGTWRRRGGAVVVTQWDEVSPGYRRRAETIAADWPLRSDEDAVVSWVGIE